MSDRAASSPIEEEKKRIRSTIRAGRGAMTADERRRASAGIADQLDALLDATAARVVACYLSLDSEPGTRDFLARPHDGIRILLPLTRDDGLLDWVESRPGAPEALGPLGVPEPVGARLPPSTVDQVDLIVIPAAAVDVHAVRLGWGRGYYDRTIGSLRAPRPVYAVIHDDELVDKVPREAHDEPVTGVVTPTRTIVFPPASER